VILDPVALAKESMGPLREALAPILKQGGQDARDMSRKISELEDDVAATVKALAETQNPGQAALLREDLDRFLPARKAAIMAQAISTGASDTQAAAEAALDVAIKIALAVGKAML
jgi:hypothetical protein